jgi:hypothetical protein
VYRITCVVVQGCNLLPGVGANVFGTVAVNRVSLPFCDTMMLWDCRGFISPVVNVCHNKCTALPVSVYGLSLTRERVLVFAFQVDELPLAVSPVDPDPIVLPCEDCVTVWIINNIPCCCYCARAVYYWGLWLWVVWSSLSDCTFPCLLPCLPLS